MHTPVCLGMNGEATHTIPPNTWKKNNGHRRPTLKDQTSNSNNVHNKNKKVQYLNFTI